MRGATFIMALRGLHAVAPHEAGEPSTTLQVPVN